MKRTFTKLMAALALLLFIAPLGMWGQRPANGGGMTREDVTVLSEDFNNGTAPGWTLTGKTSFAGSAGAKSLQIASGKGAGSAQTPAFSSLVGASATLTFTAVSSGNASRTLTITGGNCLVEGETSTTITAGTSINTFTIAITNASTASTITFSAATSQGTLIDDVLVYYTSGGTPTPSLSVSPASIAFNDKAINPSEPYEETFDVTFANLTEDLSITVGSGLTGVSVDPETIAYDATSPQTVYVSYNPTAVGSISGNITVSNTDDEVSANVAVSGSAYDPSSVVYYNLVEEDQTDWSGVYIITYAGTTYEALTGVSNNLGSHATVTVNNNGQIQSTSTIDGYAVTITKTTGDQYSLQIGGKYLYAQSSNNLYVADDFTEDECEWTIAYSNDLVLITNVDQSSRRIQYNTGSPRFACYTGTQKDLTLFKYASTEPAINVAQSIEIEYTAQDDYAIPYSISNPVSGITLTVASGADWITDVQVTTNTNGDVVTFDASANTGNIDREGTITLTYDEYDEKVVTVTQGHFVAPTPSINSGNYNLSYETTSGTITYTISNEPDPAGVLTSEVTAGSDWFSLGEDEGGSIPFTCTVNNAATERTATVIHTYTYGDNQSVTKEVTIVQSGDPNYIPTIAEVRAQGTGSVVTKGIVTSCVGTTGYIQDATAAICVYGTSLTVGDEIRISGTLTTFSGLLEITNPQVTVISQGNTVNPELMTVAQVVSSTNQGWYIRIEEATVNTISSQNVTIAQGESTIVVRFASADDITFEANDVISFNGNIGHYGQNNQIANPQNVVVQQSTEPSIYIESDAFEITAVGEDDYLEIDYANLEITQAGDFGVQFYDADNNKLNGEAAPTWIQAEVTTQTGEEGYFVYYVIGENTDTEDRTAYFKVFAMGDEDFVYSNLVTVTQAAPVVDYVTLPFNWAGGTSGDLTAVTGVSGNSLSDYAAGNAPYRVKFDNTGDYILIKTNEQPAVVSVGIKKVGGDGSSSIIIQSSSNGSDFNNVETFSNPGDQNDIMTHVTTNAFNASDRYVRIYFNKPSGGSNVGVGPIIIKGIETYTLSNITGYSGEKDHYSLIASPVTVDPATVAGMTDGDFDLYFFDQAQEDEWRNYEATPFNLVPGTGYLYAKKATTENPTYTFQLTGIPYAGNGTIPLDYTEGARFAGWNLIGNPFNTNATLNMPYYRLKDDGSGLKTTTENTAVNVMEGVFVQATAANTEAVFTQASSGAKSISQLNLKVTRNRGNVVDNAIIRFDEGATLSKFQLNPNHTKVYFQQDGKDYAVVRSANEGEMPVSFKAEKSGSYTINVEAENVEMSYLHLIDNLTGADVDLLATPSYSFEASNDDYESRFRLVFKANTDVEENAATETFAYFNGSEWVINNPSTGSGDNATLQVVDMMGRVLSSETISGNANVTLNQAAGIYVLRLVNGENVMVQKVVVR